MRSRLRRCCLRARLRRRRRGRSGTLRRCGLWRRLTLRFDRPGLSALGLWALEVLALRF